MKDNERVGVIEREKEEDAGKTSHTNYSKHLFMLSCGTNRIISFTGTVFVLRADKLNLHL